MHKEHPNGITGFVVVRVSKMVFRAAVVQEADQVVNVSVVKILNPNLPANHSMKCERQVLKQLLGVEVGL